MRCPKCHYISFDSPDRCRNCGFDLSLAPAAAARTDLPIRHAEEPVGPPVDLELGLAPPSEGAAPSPAPPAAAPGDGPQAPRLDLPLFLEPVAGVDDTPLITAPAPPRVPLAVRRSSDAPRPRQAPPTPDRQEPLLAFAEEDRQTPAPTEAAGLAPAVEAREPGEAPGVGTDDAPVPRRLAAAVVDLAITLAVDAVVLYFTLRMLGLGFAELAAVPLVPLVGFFAILNGGYVVAFTVASGQTLGKMVAGLRVVADDRGRLTAGQAVTRAAASLLSLGSLGAGFLPALVVPGGRTLHDRIAHTRVVVA